MYNDKEFEYDYGLHNNVLSMSEIGSVMGVGTQSRKKLMTKKVEKYKEEHNEYTQCCLAYGKYMERPGLMWFSHNLGKPFTKLHFQTLPYNNRIGGTPDAITSDNEIVEMKWRFFPEPNEAEPFTVPPLKYYLQVQGYLELCGYSVGYLVCCTKNHGSTVFVVNRDKNLWEIVLEECIAFICCWDCFKHVYETDKETYKKDISTYRFTSGFKKKLEQQISDSMENNCYLNKTCYNNF